MASRSGPGLDSPKEEEGSLEQMYGASIVRTNEPPLRGPRGDIGRSPG